MRKFEKGLGLINPARASQFWSWSAGCAAGCLQCTRATITLTSWGAAGTAKNNADQESRFRSAFWLRRIFGENLHQQQKKEVPALWNLPQRAPGARTYAGPISYHRRQLKVVFSLSVFSIFQHIFFCKFQKMFREMPGLNQFQRAD